MKKTFNANNYIKFFMYFIVIVLINIAGTTLSIRTDLTSGNAYSLSRASKNVVSTLSEPLTIKVFFTSRLPAPYNNIERYLHDLLEEYSLAGNRYFNYQFYNVSSELNEDLMKNQEIAMDYGIPPVQIQNIEHDEVKFQRAYMGMALLHGDIIETVPTITSTEGLEYKITSTIRKMNNKISALKRLKNKIEIKLFLSSSLQGVGPYMNLTGLSDLPGKINKIVNTLNDKHYGMLTFSHLDPGLQEDSEKEAVRNNILALQWNDFMDRHGKKIPADKGYAGIVIQHDKKSEQIQLIQVIRIPIFGTQYQLADLDELEHVMNETIEYVLHINEEIGYLADHGTHKLSAEFQMPQKPLSNFNKILSEEYTITQVNMGEDGLPETLSFLIIAGVKENFSEYELYQIDQFLMKGKTLALFLDSFMEISPRFQNSMTAPNQGPFSLPINTGLEKLLKHYGLLVKKSYVLDKNCFKQRIPQQFGGGEHPIYFAPIIRNQMINKEVGFLKNIKGLATLKASPVEINEQKIKEQGLNAIRLFSSSEKSWEMADRINLNPLAIQPPAGNDRYRSIEMAYILEGSFSSYFADRPVPVKEDIKDDANEDTGKTKKDTSGIDMSHIQAEGITISKGKPGKIFLIGTSEILKDSVIDKDGNSPNAHFVMNVIDSLNNREENAIMRARAQRFNPLRDVNPETRTIIKTFNIAGLPILVCFAGLIVWFRRASKKRIIQQMFRK